MSAESVARRDAAHGGLDGSTPAAIVGAVEEDVRPHGESRVTKQSWYATLVAGTGMGFDAYVINLPVILILPIAAAYGVSPERIAAVQTIFLLGYFIGTMGFATAADRFGRKVTLAVSIIGFSAATVLTGLMPTLTLFAVWRFISGILGGGEQSVGAVYAAEAWPDKWRGWGTGNMFTFYPLGVFLLILANLVLVPWLGLTSAFFFAGFMGILLFFLRYHLVEPDRFKKTREIAQSQRPKGLKHTPMFEVVRQPALRRPWLSLLLINFGDNFTYHGFSVGFILYVNAVFSPDTTVLLQILLGLYALQFVMSALGSYLQDVIGRRPVGIGIYVTVIAGIVVMLQMDTLAGTVAVAAVAQSLALGPAWCVKLTATAEAFPTEMRGSGMAMTLGLSRIAGFISPVLIAGMIAAVGAQDALYIYCISGLVSLIGYLLLPEMARKPMLDLVSELPGNRREPVPAAA
jgi:putative MFS transporter